MALPARPGGPKKGLDLIVGVVATASLVFAIAAITFTFAGRFSDVVTVTARVAQAGDALQPGDPVSYRDIIIGRVAEAEGLQTGGAVLRLRIEKEHAEVVPANVTAIAIPATLFGAFLVRLIPPKAGTEDGQLSDGKPVPADISPSALGLQSALSDVYQLLNAIDVGQLDAALSALANALEGEGDNIGVLLEKANAYLRGLQPALPTLEAAVRNLAIVSEQVARNAPDLLSSVDNLVDVSQAFVASRDSLHQLLNVGIPTLARTEKALRDHGDKIVTIVTNERKVIDAFAASPEALPQLIDGGKTLADLFGLAFRGEQANLVVLLTGANLATLGPLILGEPGELFKTISDVPGYTGAHCPQYPGLSGGGCAAAAQTSAGDYRVLSSGTVTPASPRRGGTVGPVGSPAERDAVAAYLSSASTLPGDPAVAQLLIGPVLRGRTTVVTS